jgi:hypothetical protein
VARGAHSENPATATTTALAKTALAAAWMGMGKRYRRRRRKSGMAAICKRNEDSVNISRPEAGDPLVK